MKKLVLPLAAMVALTASAQQFEVVNVEQVPTGDTYKYEAHTELKSSNKIPAWLKKKVN